MTEYGGSMMSTMRRMVPLIVSSCLALAPCIARAHHAAAAIYDRSRVTEVEGDITSVYWRNPHVLFTMRISGVDGAVWKVESNSVSVLSRMNVTSDTVEVGDTVRIAGWPARRDETRLFVSNLLLPDGRELLLIPGVEPRWSTETLGDSSRWIRNGVVPDEADATSTGIFRVWTEDMTSPPLFRDVATLETEWPLTAAAAAARARWDPVADSPYLGCTTMGMPRLMGQPYPMEFIDQGDHILLRIELYDAVRTIHLTDALPADAQPRTPLGYSTGRWEGSALVVHTTGIDWPLFDQSGIPQSDAMDVVERFSVSEDESRLYYVLTVTDRATFTEPVTLSKFWVWRPDEEVQPFECESPP